MVLAIIFLQNNLHCVGNMVSMPSLPQDIFHGIYLRFGRPGSPNQLLWIFFSVPPECGIEPMLRLGLLDCGQVCQPFAVRLPIIHVEIDNIEQQVCYFYGNHQLPRLPIIYMKIDNIGRKVRYLQGKTFAHKQSSNFGILLNLFAENFHLMLCVVALTVMEHILQWDCVMVL